MIKLTNREMLGILNCSIFTQNLPARMSYFFALLKKQMEIPAKVIDDERRKIGEKYGEINENGDGFTILPEFRDTVNSEIESLMDIEVELNGEKIDIDLNEIDELNINLTADDMMLLLPVVNFKETNSSGAPK